MHPKDHRPIDWMLVLVITWDLIATVLIANWLFRKVLGE